MIKMDYSKREMQILIKGVETVLEKTQRNKEVFERANLKDKQSYGELQELERQCNSLLEKLKYDLELNE